MMIKGIKSKINKDESTTTITSSVSAKSLLPEKVLKPLKYAMSDTFNTDEDVLDLADM